MCRVENFCLAIRFGAFPSRFFELQSRLVAAISMSAPTAFLSGLVGPRIAARSPLAACRHRQQLGRAPVRSIVCMAALPTQDDLQSASFLESVRHAETLLGFREVTVADPKIKLLDAMLETSNGARG